MLKPRIIALFALLVLILPILAACGADTPATTAPAPTTAAAVATTAPAPTTAASGGAATTAPVATAAPTQAAAPTDAPATTAPTAAAPAGNVLRVHELAYPDVFDPQKSSYSNEISILSQNYEGLTRLNENLETIPAAAEKWEYNTDASIITFTMKPDLKYSDGSPLTAANFEYAVRRTCDPETAGEYQSILFDIAGCADLAGTVVTDTAALETARQALGVSSTDTTITFKLAQPAPYFHTVASLWVMYPAKQELIEKGGDNWWQKAENHIGNGPFQMTNITEDLQIDFVRNENYQGDKAKLDGLQYLYIGESSVALQAYKDGQLDVMTPDPSQLPAIKEDASLAPEFVQYAAATTIGAQFNLKQPPFDDPKMREAFAYAFDRATYCEVVRNGDCLPTLTWIPPGIPGYDETETRFSFDPAKAKEALAASKYANNVPEITFVYSNADPATQPRVEFIAQMIKENLGIELKLQGLPSKDISALKKDNKTYPQLSLGGWNGDYPDPQNWLSVYWRSDTTFAARPGYDYNKDADALMTKGDTTIDQAERIKAYQEAQKLVIGDVPMAMLYNATHYYLVKPYVTGYAKTPQDGTFPGQWSSMTIERNK